MNYEEFLQILEDGPEKIILIQHPVINGSTIDFVPCNFHITEVGRLTKDFVDCGGFQRSQSSAICQIWFANDVNHRLSPEKLVKIFKMADNKFDLKGLPVEFEYQQRNSGLSLYKIDRIENSEHTICIILGNKNTACLAPDKCGVSGCC